MDLIFLAGRGRGMSLVPTAITAKAFTEYFQNAASRSGYGLNVTLYAWQRKTATNMSRVVGPDRIRHGLNHSAKSRTLEYHYEQGNFDLPVFEIAMGDVNLEAAQQEMTDNASPALTRFADQSRLEERIEGLSTELANSDIALQDAVARNDRDGTNIAKARIKCHVEKQAYEEGRRAAEDALTVHEVYNRKRELHDMGKIMRMVREHFSKTAIARLESHRDDQLYDLREKKIHGQLLSSSISTIKFCLSMELLTKFLTQQCL